MHPKKLIVLSLLGLFSFLSLANAQTTVKGTVYVNNPGIIDIFDIVTGTVYVDNPGIIDILSPTSRCGARAIAWEDACLSRKGTTNQECCLVYTETLAKCVFARCLEGSIPLGHGESCDSIINAIPAVTAQICNRAPNLSQ